MTYNFGRTPDHKVKGVLFTKANEDDITLTPTSHDGLANAAYIPVRRTTGAGIHTEYVVKLTAAITLATDGGGVNGLDTNVDGGAARADTKSYYVYLICKENLADPALIMSLTTPFPTANYPTDYVMVSAPLMFIHIYDDSGTLKVRDFVHQLDGWVAFAQLDKLVSNGVSTSNTAVDLTDFYPKHCYAKIRFRASNTGTNNCSITFRGSADGTGDTTFAQIGAIDGDASGQWDDVQQQITFPVTANLGTSFYYQWTNAPTGGLQLWSSGFKMSVY